MEEEIEESAGRKERTSTVTVGGERDESNEKEEKEKETPSRAIGKNIRGAVRHNTGRGQQFKIAAWTQQI